MPNTRAIAIVSGQQAGARWSTGAAYVVVAKAHGFAVKTIDVGRLDCAVSVASEIAIALVVREDKDNIGSGFSCHGLLSERRWTHCAEEVSLGKGKECRIGR